jgi:hypothetical protein
MIVLLTLLLLAALFGIGLPYIKGSKRWHFAVASLIILLLFKLLASTENEKSLKTDVASKPVGVMPAKPRLSIDPKVLDAHRVQLTIGTNLPMPIQVATSIDLHGQKDDDTYVGYTEYIKLVGPTTVIVLDTSKTEKPLPTGLYDAAVTFYPKWGAEGNSLAKGVPQLHVEKQVRLSASGGTAKNYKLSAELIRHGIGPLINVDLARYKRADQI